MYFYNQKKIKYIESQEIWTFAYSSSAFYLGSFLNLIIGFNQEQWLL